MKLINNIAFLSNLYTPAESVENKKDSLFQNKVYEGCSDYLTDN